MTSKEEIINTIVGMSGKYNPYVIFHDWVEMMAISIQNGCTVIRNDLYIQREKDFSEIQKKYCTDEQHKFSDMLGLLVLAYQDDGLCDYLGEIFMETGCGSGHTGQFFTPYHLALLDARIALVDYTGDKMITLNEPTCGGGAMIIAAAQCLHEKGLNYQRLLNVYAQDLDWMAVYMCYVQLSLLGIRAVVVQGDTLSAPYRNDYSLERRLMTPCQMGMLV